MIHYHGGPLSGKQGNKSAFWGGRHGLVSFIYQEDMQVVAECCASFVLDNGAFTVWNKGGKLDIEGYYRFVEQWHKHPGFDWALIPDVIDGDEDANDRLIEQWPKHMRGVPVWHMHESLERLYWLAMNHQTVALGSSGDYRMPNSTPWWGRMKDAMNMICDEDGRPSCRLHGLRMLNPAVFTRLPLASADSTNACVNAGSKGRFGLYVPVNAAERANIIADRIEAQQSAARWGLRAERHSTETPE